MYYHRCVVCKVTVQDLTYIATSVRVISVSSRAHYVTVSRRKTHVSICVNISVCLPVYFTSSSLCTLLLDLLIIPFLLLPPKEVVCLSVCLSVGWITKELMNGFR